MIVSAYAVQLGLHSSQVLTGTRVEALLPKTNPLPPVYWRWVEEGGVCTA
jgi:hypothetical protein